MTARSGPNAKRIALHALAVAAMGVALSVAIWSILAGGICGSAGSQWVNYATWFLPPAFAALFGWTVLKARWYAIAGGLALGLAVGFWLWAYVIFGACG